ncbi:unnamed protein product [Amoebophrya sp. A25]|nr:unnamed protein product [Amoebophrya sp. A25]|eukprot:GSA25T00012704001.1
MARGSGRSRVSPSDDSDDGESEEGSETRPLVVSIPKQSLDVFTFAPWQKVATFLFFVIVGCSTFSSYVPYVVSWVVDSPSWSFMDLSDSSRSSCADEGTPLKSESDGVEDDKEDEGSETEEGREDKRDVGGRDKSTSGGTADRGASSQKSKKSGKGNNGGKPAKGDNGGKPASGGEGDQPRRGSKTHEASKVGAFVSNAESGTPSKKKGGGVTPMEEKEEVLLPAGPAQNGGEPPEGRDGQDGTGSEKDGDESERDENGDEDGTAADREASSKGGDPDDAALDLGKCENGEAPSWATVDRRGERPESEKPSVGDALISKKDEITKLSDSGKARCAKLRQDSAEIDKWLSKEQVPWLTKEQVPEACGEKSGPGCVIFELLKTRQAVSGEQVKAGSKDWIRLKHDTKARCYAADMGTENREDAYTTACAGKDIGKQCKITSKDGNGKEVVNKGQCFENWTRSRGDLTQESLNVRYKRGIMQKTFRRARCECGILKEWRQETQNMTPKETAEEQVEEASDGEAEETADE